MTIEEIEELFHSRNIQRIEMMARKILCNGRSHEFVKSLSLHADTFNELLGKTEPKDKDYLALVYILGEHLQDVKNGQCACSIVKKPMFNCPSRLEGILEILDEQQIEEKYAIVCHSKCLSCGTEFESERVPYGHGEKVYWRVCS